MCRRVLRHKRCNGPPRRSSSRTDSAFSGEPRSSQHCSAGVASSSVMGFYTAGHMWATLCSTARHSPGRGPYSLRSCRSQRQRACPMVEPCRSLMRSARAGVHPRPPPRAVRVRLGPHALCAQGTAPQSTGSADLPCRRASCPLGGGRGGCRIGRLGRCRLRRSLQTPIRRNF